jgi:ParB-like chromosome segregation protein Spo0J
MASKRNSKRSGNRVWHGAEQLTSTLVAIDAVEPDPRNARKHDKRNLQAIAASLQEFGQLRPIVVVDGVIVAGNGTHAAARKLGWSHIAALSTDLAPAAARAFSIADNRTAELASWDLAELVDAMSNEDVQRMLGAQCFTAEEVAELIGELETAAAEPAPDVVWRDDDDDDDDDDGEAGPGAEWIEAKPTAGADMIEQQQQPLADAARVLLGIWHERRRIDAEATEDAQAMADLQVAFVQATQGDGGNGLA